MTYYVATYRPAYPSRDVCLATYKAKGFSYDLLPPTLTSLWRVDHVQSKGQAIACVIEKAAGKGTTVSRIIPTP